MPNLNGKRKLQAIFLVLFVTSVAYAKIAGPDAGYTDAPGDLGNCTACHDTFEVPNVGPGSVNLSGNPRGERVAVITYSQGQRAGIYTFTAGRLSSIERGPEPVAPPKAAKSKAKKKPAAT